MNCWKVLGIDQTSDTRAVKRAYATRLKQCRPDEDPQGFSELHTAYKTALQQARYLDETSPENHAQDDIASLGSSDESGLSRSEHRQSENIDGQLTEQVIDEVLHAAKDGQEVSIETGDEQASLLELQNTWQQLVAETDVLLEHLYQAHKVDSWVFLEESPALFDIQFKSEFSQYLFGEIINLRERYPADPSLPPDIIHYLNGIFRWTDRRDLLEDDFGYDNVESILGSPDGVVQEVAFQWFSPKVHRGRMEYGGYYARMTATVVDIILFLFIQSLVAKFSLKLGMPNFLSELPGPLAALILYAILAPLMEASPLQATPGKLLFGMKVVSPKGVRLNIFHAVARVLIFIASTAAFKITVWINMFMYDGRLLHDRGSHSIVIRR